MLLSVKIILRCVASLFAVSFNSTSNAVGDLVFINSRSNTQQMLLNHVVTGKLKRQSIMENTGSKLDKIIEDIILPPVLSL